MKRFLCGCILLALAVGTVQAQVGKYTPLPAVEGDPEALKRLAAMLGGGNDAKPQLDPKMLELLQKFLKDTENAPERRQKMMDLARKQAQENPEQFQKQFQQDNPGIDKDDLKKLMQNLGKPGDPAPPGLPKPGGRPPNVVGTPPIPVPPGPNQPKSNPTSAPMPPPKATQVPDLKPPKGPSGQPNSEQVQGAVQMWEQIVGPIDSTPAVKDAIVDLFGNSKGGPNEKPFWDSPEFTGGTPSSSSPKSGFWKFLNGGTGGSSWTSPGWMKSLTTSTPSTPSAPKTGFSGPSFGGFGGAGLSGLGAVGTVILVLVVAAVVGFLIWKFLPMIREARNRKLQPLPGQGPWPVDPRTIRDREGLVLAFEYLSILVCGNGAVVWNHLTIAEALRDALPEKEHLAEPLARLYAVARYTPLREEIPESAYAEARHCLCQLAGVAEL